MVLEEAVEAKSLHLPSGFDTLPPGWSWSRLDDACQGVFDCPHSTPKLVETGPFVVRTQDIITGIFRTDEAARVSEETYKERTSRVSPMRGDLLYSREGTYFGIAAEVPERTRVCLGQRMVLIRPKAALLDFRFLCHWLNSPIMASHIHGYRDGTVAERLNLPTIRALPILVPPLLEQKAIAQILVTLDDKIELNRRMNATLEAMARTLFQSWFVDFDPVRAKLDARPPIGLDPATAALFPSSFDHDKEGALPNGWERKRWGEIATLEYGKSLRDYEGSAGKYRVFGTNGPIGSHNQPLCNGAGIVIGRKGAYRGVHYSPEPFFVIDTAFYLKPKVSLDLKWAYYELLRFDINSMDSGSAIPSTSRDDFYAIPVIFPPSTIQRAFGEIVSRWFAQFCANEQQSRTLAALRDTLLPKLLSGEVRTVGVSPLRSSPAP